MNCDIKSYMGLFQTEAVDRDLHMLFYIHHSLSYVCPDRTNRTQLEAIMH